MGILRSYTPWEREFREVWRKEQWFLRRHEKRAGSALENKVNKLVPKGVTEPLHGAFARAFGLVFEKGTGAIRWVSRQPARRRVYEEHALALEEWESREALRAFSKEAARAGVGNIAAAGVTGVGMGLMGVALPDVPLFVVLVLKSVYDIAESYGFSCENEAEKIYILRLIEAALSDGRELRERNRSLDVYAQGNGWPEEIGLNRQIRMTARQLSEFVLYSKALQGVPVAGAVGGVMDAVCLERIQRYAAIKYQKRFLICCRLKNC